MITDKLKELETLRAKAAELEAQINEARTAELRGLPRQYGFESAEDFVEAVLAASGDGPGRRRRKGPSSKAGRRRSRATITDETRVEVKKLVQAGKTGVEIAKQIGISLPSVHNIKKALGLVRKRK